MPYISAHSWVDQDVIPLEGESYLQFATRVYLGIKALSPYQDDAIIEEQVMKLWASHVLKTTDEVIVHMRRPKNTYIGYDYEESWFGDWEIKDIFAAASDGKNLPDTATAGSGDLFNITKSKDDEQLVFGWANIAIDTTGNFPIDWDGDFTDPSDLEKAAYSFVLKYRQTGENHEGEAKGELVESVMFTKEKQEAMGIPEGVVPEGWWVGFHVPDAEVFAKIKSGEYQMFSVQGQAIRKPAS